MFSKALLIDTLLWFYYDWYTWHIIFVYCTRYSTCFVGLLEFLVTVWSLNWRIKSVLGLLQTTVKMEERNACTRFVWLIPCRAIIVLLVVLTEWISQYGANGSVVIGVRPVTQRLLVQALLWSLDVMCCVLIDIVLVYQAAVGYRLMLGGQLVMDWCPIQGKPMNHPLSSTLYQGNHWPFCALMLWRRI